MQEIKDYKKNSELDFWKGMLEKDGGVFVNSFYTDYYITHFDFKYEDYKDKKILDIGCGPSGSLEWADMAKVRIGLDPLIHDYYKLNGGTLEHKMKYVCAYSEDMPFADETFDFVFSLNSLDHVDDLDDTISEIKRVLKIGGYFSCLVDANHDPTPCEPITIDFNLKEKFFPEFELIHEQAYESILYGMNNNIKKKLYYDWDNPEKRGAILLLKFKKVSNPPKKEEDSPNYDFDELHQKFDMTYEDLMNKYLMLEEENNRLNELIEKYKERKVVKMADYIKNIK